MTRNIFILLQTMAVLFLMNTGAAAWDGTVVKVLDGDSLKVQRNREIVEIRLYGIDTPEYRQAYSNKAKQFTKRLAYGQRVSVEEKDIDRYGRIVALVTSRGKLVNRELVREGLAWYYAKYCLAQPLCGELRQLEKKARRESRGLWRDKNPVSPRDWKRQHQEGGSERRTSWYRRLLDRL